MYKTYYCAYEVLKYKALTNLVLSDRSDGKTLDIKARGFISYKENGTQFIYLRRWKSELSSDIYETFYDELVELVQEGKYIAPPEILEKVSDIVNYEFLHTKSKIYIRKKGTEKWDIICYLTPLTMSSKKKSSFKVKRIKRIEYDEFIPLDCRYVPNEMSILMEFYKSIDRDRDSTILNLFGNRIDNFNPFFDYFNIHLGIQKEKIKMYKDNTIAIQIYINNEHREERSKSRFNKMTKGTEYEGYNSGGILFNDIIKIGNTNGCWYFASFKSCLGEGCIYASTKQLVITSNKRKDGDLIVDKIYNTPGRNEFLITYGNLPSLFKNKAKKGMIYYDKESTYHLFEPLLNKIGGMK